MFRSLDDETRSWIGSYLYTYSDPSYDGHQRSCTFRVSAARGCTRTESDVSELCSLVGRKLPMRPPAGLRQIDVEALGKAWVIFTVFKCGSVLHFMTHLVDACPTLQPHSEIWDLVVLLDILCSEPRDKLQRCGNQGWWTGIIPL